MYLKQHTVCTRTIHFSFFDFVEHVYQSAHALRNVLKVQNHVGQSPMCVWLTKYQLYINNWKSVVGPNSFMVQKIASQFRQQPSQSRKQPHSPENSLIVQKIASQPRKQPHSPENSHHRIAACREYGNQRRHFCCFEL